MPKCIWCGREFEPLALPEVPEQLFGLKSPHKVICPFCATKEAGKVASFIAATIDALKEREKGKLKG